MLSCIIWDFNGTLLDDVETSIATVNDSLAKYSLPLTDLEEYRRNITMPITDYYAKHFDLSVIPMAELASGYLNGFELYHHLLKPGKGALDALKALKARGVRQCVVSSYEQVRLESLLCEFGMYEFMDGISGAEDTKCESKVQRGARWIKEQGIDPENAIVVGDLTHDFEMAQAMGARCLLFAGGHQDKKRLLACGVPVIDDLTEVLNYE